MNWQRTFSPKTNPAFYSALLGVAYAIWQGELAATATGPLTWARVSHIAAGVVWAYVSTWIRGKVTPVADPRDGNGAPLASPGLIGLGDGERRRAENLRLTYAPGTPSFYPYPGGVASVSAPGPTNIEPPAGTTP